MDNTEQMKSSIPRSQVSSLLRYFWIDSRDRANDTEKSVPAM